MFLHVSVILFTDVGGTWAGTPTPPPGRYSPQAGTPPGQIHPLHRYLPGRYTPLGRYSAPRVCRDTVNKRAVRILLECILVHSWFLLGYNSNNIVYQNTVERFVKRGISSKIDGYSCYFSRHLIATSKSQYV